NATYSASADDIAVQLVMDI
ncbi:hypothetical protein Tco_1457832, partial [Tanacetum coccineum]